MSDIVIKQEEKQEKQTDEGDIKETLKQADEYQKLKEQNDKLEAEYLRRQELKAKLALDGRASAGEEIKKDTTQEDKDKESVDRLVNQFK